MKGLDYEIFAIGDSAVTIHFGNVIDESINDIVHALSNQIDAVGFEGFIECVPAYSSLSIFYKPQRNFGFDELKKWVKSQLEAIDIQQNKEYRIVEIPVVYDGEDLDFVAQYCDLTTDEVVEIHTSALYRVFMMGFLPGFAYMGGMNERIATPRKNTPRLKVPAGSVGIAGKQTGIYPLESPGGWQLIGRTNLKLFNSSKNPSTLLKAGDRVKFVRV
ncbi:MAG: 5-oxoprolinase subunit PxpB [Spirosomataceae bacterium]